MATSIALDSTVRRPWQPTQVTVGTEAPAANMAVEVRIDETMFAHRADAVAALELIVRAMREQRLPRTPWTA